MKTTSHNLMVEKELLNQLEIIERRISDLKQEKDVIQKMIHRVRKTSLISSDVTRTNSLERILVESAIREYLESVGVPVKSSDLFGVIKSMSYDLKSTTFRSYLHRMKEKGIVSRGIDYGTWVLSRN